jgi:glycosyltransferase involved in cell wall biosynthesis
MSVSVATLPVTPEVGGVKIVCIMMVKNESTNIERSIVSVKDLDGLVLFDTGSTDDTIEKTKELCKSHNLPFYLLQGEFEDFSKSRNKLIEYAQSLNISDWMILLDANDELQNVPKLREYLGTVKDLPLPPLDYAKAMFVNYIIDTISVRGTSETPTLQEILTQAKAKAQVYLFGKVSYEESINLVNGLEAEILRIAVSGPRALYSINRCVDHVTRDVIYLKQKWKIAENNYLEFKNHRCIRSDTTMRYTGVVHECLVESNPNKQVARANEILDDVIVYQDRLLDTTMSSERRWIRDKKLLQREYNKKVVDPRTIFYYAQTCKCLKEHSLSKKLYEERYSINEGFQEERYVAAYECGMATYFESKEEFVPPPEASNPKKKVDVEFLRKHFENGRRHLFEEAQTWMLRAFEHSQRAEPILVLAKHYCEKKQWHIAHMYSSMACKIPEPKDALLWYNSQVYTYDRWHINSLTSYHTKNYQEAITSCEKAIEARNEQSDVNNLAHFKTLVTPPQQIGTV